MVLSSQCAVGSPLLGQGFSFSGKESPHRFLQRPARSLAGPCAPGGNCRLFLPSPFPRFILLIDTSTSQFRQPRHSLASLPNPPTQHSACSSTSYFPFDSFMLLLPAPLRLLFAHSLAACPNPQLFASPNYLSSFCAI